MEHKQSIGVFSLLAILVIVMIGFIGVRVFYYYDFPIFTDEEQIEEAMVDEFGIFAEYL